VAWSHYLDSKKRYRNKKALNKKEDQAPKISISAIEWKKRNTKGLIITNKNKLKITHQ
jgi:hypothetical protein